MRGLIKPMGKFTGKLIISPKGDGIRWVLEESFIYYRYKDPGTAGELFGGISYDTRKFTSY